MTELLPCPFCGGRQTYRKHDGGVWLTTTNHKRGCIMRDALSFVAFDTEAEAIAAWNTRAERETVNKTGDFVTHDSRTTELTTIIEALTALASAITWTVPNSTPSVESYLKDAWAAIDKLKDGCDE